MDRTIDQRFALRRKLGAGGFGEVWLADDLKVGGEVAIKILHADMGSRAKVVERFQREVRVLGSINHPNLVRLVAAKTDGEPYYLAMPVVAGLTVGAEMRERAEARRGFSFEEIVHVIDRLAAALTTLHKHDIVHRDVKPNNVMITVASGIVDNVCLLDLGIAKIEVHASDQTTVGRLMGTLMYMAPEQIRGEVADARADQFALAVIAYELATLRRPFSRGADGRPCSIQDGPIVSEGLNANPEVVRRIVFEPRPRAVAVRPELGKQFDEVLHKAMAWRSADRFGSCPEFADALRAALEAPRDAAPADKTEHRSVPVRHVTQELEFESGRLPSREDTDANEPALTAVLPRNLTTSGDRSNPSSLETTHHTRPRQLFVPALIGCAVAVIVAVGVVFWDRPEPIEPTRPAPNPVENAATPSAVRVSPRVVTATVPPAKVAVEVPQPPPKVTKPAQPPPKKIVKPAPPPLVVDPLKFDPNQPASIMAVARKLEVLATQLPTASAQTTIKRCASLAAMRADATDLKACVARYKKARAP